MGVKFKIKRLLLLTLIFLCMTSLVYGEEVDTVEVEAHVQIKKYSGERLDIPTPEEREELNLLLSIEEPEIVPGGVIQILNKEDELIVDDISIDEAGIGEISLPIGEYKLIDKTVPEGYDKEVYEFEVREQHVDNGLVLESYNQKKSEDESVLEEEARSEDQDVIEINTKDESVKVGDDNKEDLKTLHMSKDSEAKDLLLDSEIKDLSKKDILPATGNSMDSLIIGIFILVIGCSMKFNLRRVG